MSRGALTIPRAGLAPISSQQWFEGLLCYLMLGIIGCSGRINAGLQQVINFIGVNLSLVVEVSISKSISERKLWTNSRVRSNNFGKKYLFFPLFSWSGVFTGNFIRVIKTTESELILWWQIVFPKITGGPSFLQFQTLHSTRHSSSILLFNRNGNRLLKCFHTFCWPQFFSVTTQV